MRKHLIMSMILLVAFTFSGIVTAEEWCGETTYVSVQTPHPYPKADKGQLVWEKTIREDNVFWLKLHFSKFKINDEDYIELVDMYGQVIETIKGTDIYSKTPRFKVERRDEKSNRVDFWGPAIDGDQVTIRLYRGSDKKTGWGFSVDQLGLGFKSLSPEISVFESICGSDNKVSIACASTSYQNLGKAVGQMTYQKNGSWYVCTGFLVSCNSSHFLTNEHCITSQTQVNTLQVRFNYRLSSCGGSNASYSTYYGSSFITDSSYYDFCLLTLGGSPQNTYGYLGLINGNPIANEDIYIIQHPAGRRQEIGFGTVNSTSAYSGRDFNYYVDTEGGSSGSPVFAETEDEVLGLHHYGGCPNSAVKMNYIYDYITGYIGCN